MSPGQLVKTARTRAGLTQARLARRAGTSQAAISRLEHDRVSPSVETLRAVLALAGEELATSSERVDYGHDLALLRANLGMTPAERLESITELSNFLLEHRLRAAGG